MFPATSVNVAFDKPNLIADAGLVPVGTLAEQVGMPGRVAEHLAITDADNAAGANPAGEGAGGDVGRGRRPAASGR